MIIIMYIYIYTYIYIYIYIYIFFFFLGGGGTGVFRVVLLCCGGFSALYIYIDSSIDAEIAR